MATTVSLPGAAFSRSGNDTTGKPKRKAHTPKPKAAPAPWRASGGGKRGGGKRGNGSTAAAGDGGEFLSLRAAKRDVFDFGASGLGKRQQRIRENEKLVAFGAKAAKNPKMPFKMLMGIRRAEDKREQKAAAERRQSGVVAPIEKRDATRGGAKAKRKRRSGDLAAESKDGVMRVGHLLKRRKS